MLLMRYGLGILGMVLAVLVVSHPGAGCASGCRGGGLGAMAQGEVGELLPGLFGLLGLAHGWPPWQGARATAAR